MSRHLIPNSTQIPDVLLDHWMAILSGAEFKVLLYIARRTYGFGKDKDSISLSQIAQGITKRDGNILDRGTGMSRSSVTRALNTLVSTGAVLRKTSLTYTGREFEENTYSINLAWSPEDPGQPSGQNGCGQQSGDEEEGVVLKSDYPPSNSSDSKKNGRVVPKSDHLVPEQDYLVSKSKQGWSQNRTTVVPKSDLQETDQQETDQETATSSAQLHRPPTYADDDFLDLVRTLAANGVGRSVAEQLAREKPDECRRCLEYLPFVKLKSTSGAYLADAIRKGYGPPPGFEAAKKGQTPERSKGQRDEQTGEQERCEIEQKESKLRQQYAELEARDPAGITEFLAFADSERKKAERIAQQLSAKRRQDVLSSWEHEGRKLERFERWLTCAQSRAGRMIGPTTT